MRRAAQGATTPNPMVGAVVVSPDGVVVGQGWHPRAGEPHAEVNALDEAGERARGAHAVRDARAVLPPRPDRTRARGGSSTPASPASWPRCADPNPLVNGRGFDELRAHGIAVEAGVLEAEAARLNGRSSS